ncbi:hypothetical protein J6TS7_13520 [Paenibacillus dendritiformis]|nr:hypothetical protein J6TS7_13520 [Paenibacillus dendritiformis]
MNLVPFRDVIKGINGAIREAILNIIMLIPFGFLLPIRKKKKCNYYNSFFIIIFFIKRANAITVYMVSRTNK